jgi:hypothetical protein
MKSQTWPLIWPNGNPVTLGHVGTFYLCRVTVRGRVGESKRRGERGGK